MDEDNKDNMVNHAERAAIVQHGIGSTSMGLSYFGAQCP